MLFANAKALDGLTSDSAAPSPRSEGRAGTRGRLEQKDAAEATGTSAAARAVRDRERRGRRSAAPHGPAGRRLPERDARSKAAITQIRSIRAASRAPYRRRAALASAQRGRPRGVEGGREADAAGRHLTLTNDPRGRCQGAPQALWSPRTMGTGATRQPRAHVSHAVQRGPPALDARHLHRQGPHLHVHRIDYWQGRRTAPLRRRDVPGRWSCYRDRLSLQQVSPTNFKVIVAQSQASWGGELGFEPGPRARRTFNAEPPAERLTRSASFAQPAATRRVGAAGAVVCDPHHEAGRPAPHGDRDAVAAAYFATLASARRTRSRRPPPRRAARAPQPRAARRDVKRFASSGSAAPHPPSVSAVGWMPRASSRSSSRAARSWRSTSASRSPPTASRAPRRAR